MANRLDKQPVSIIMPDSNQAILIVDDDPSVRKLLRRCFERESYTVFAADSGTSMFEVLRNQHIDLITLDLSLGDEDGLDLARKLRAESDISIIMVSGRGELIDTVVGLEVGADDYITKPFELREVLARVRTVLRRSQKSQSAAVPASAQQTGHKYSFANWVLDQNTRELTTSTNIPCELTTGEYELLEIMVLHPRKVLTRDQIMDRMKGHAWNPADRTIDNHIARLRKKLQPVKAGPQLIKTIRGTGYMFTAEVHKTGS